MTQFYIAGLCACVLLAGTLQSQTIIHPATGSSSQTITCGTTYTYKDPGAGNPYGNSQLGTLVLNPSVGTSHVQIVFDPDTFDIEPNGGGCYDWLRIYDGPNTGFPLLGTYCNSNVPGTITATNNSLTLVFDSDGSVVGSGWDASISCFNPCGVNPGTASATPSTLCVAGFTTLSLTGQDVGTTLQWQSSPDNATWSNIGGATSTPHVQAVASSTYYRCAVTNGCTSYTTSVYVSVGGAAIPGKYYVNDNSIVGDVWCLAVGNAANNGQNPCSPKATVQDVIDTYDLDPGDTIFIDAGSYTQGVDLTVTSDIGSAAGDIVFQGAGTGATIMTAPASDDNFYLFDLRYIRIADIRMINNNAGRYNVHMFNGNYYWVDECLLDNSGGTNVLMNTSNQTYDIDNNTISNSTINNTSTSSYAIHIWGDADWDTIRNNTIVCTGTSDAYAILLDDFSSGLSNEWPTDTWIFQNNITADDYGIVSRADDGYNSNGYEFFQNTITLTSTDQILGACIRLQGHGTSSDVSNIYANLFIGGSNGIFYQSAVDYTQIYNNFFCGNLTGLRVGASTSENNDLYHNSFYNSVDNLIFGATGNDLWNVRNNIFYNTGSSFTNNHCVNLPAATARFQSIDGNIYYMPNGAAAGDASGTNYTFAGWQAVNKDDPATLGDENSFNTDPNYSDPASCDLVLTGNYQTGVSVGSVTDDIFGTARTNPTIGAWEESAVLPVELVSFNGVCKDDHVLVTWATATETNNDYFVLQRSDDGFNFETVATIEGTGTSTYMNFYEIRDQRSFTGVCYYRLIQLDFNGHKHTYDIIAVSECTQEGAGLSHVFPNPMADELNIVFTTFEDQVIKILITNAVGQQVVEKSFNVTEGNNQLNVSTIDLAAGSYQLMIMTDSGELIDAEPLIKN